MSLVELKDVFNLSIASKKYQNKVEEVTQGILLASHTKYGGDMSKISSALEELKLLSSPLEFDMMLGHDARFGYVGGNRSKIYSTNSDGSALWDLNEAVMSGQPYNYTGTDQTAICRNHIMTSGKHYAVFSLYGNVCYDMFYVWAGIIRPINRAWGERSYQDFAVWDDWRHGMFLKDKTDDWDGSNVHYCHYYPFQGECQWGDWNGTRKEEDRWVGGVRGHACFRNGVQKVGLLLDLDEGTLSVYINGEDKGVMKDNLSGPYCWMTTLRAQCCQYTTTNPQHVSIERLPLPSTSG